MPANAKARPRTKPAEERRRELMSAAERVFLEFGVASATIDQITSAADVGKGTFYLYFSSKEDVLAALRDRYAEELLAKIKTATSEVPEQDWKGRLGASVRACLHGYLDAIRLHDILFYGSRPPTREGLVDNIVIDHLFDLLRGGVAAGAWAVDDPRFTAVFLFSGLHGIVDDAHIKEKRINRGRLEDRLERLCFRAVGLLPD
ncbi:MAG TPA: TetR/AcrR family transcriptional regulator [Blastocatellia bacterium]|nr:TetR/AcrR family transcriptional regulator [Blastocatellia bacterium]